MPLNIKDTETHQLAKKLAGLTGESLTKAVKHAIQDKLTIVEQAKSANRVADQLDQIALHCANLPRQDNRTSEEIIGYDDDGLPQ